MSAKFFGIDGAQKFVVVIRLADGNRLEVKSDLTCTSWSNQAPGAGMSLFYIARQVLEDYPGSHILWIETAGKI